MERKSFALAEFKVDAGSGEFEGYGSVFKNVDGGGDIVLPGAFAKALPAFLEDGFISWSHDWSQPVAMPTQAKEDKRGLYLAGAFHSTPEGQRARTIAQERQERGLRTGLSIGYAVEEEERLPKGRGLKTINPLYEVGFVMVPMNREANLAGVKSGDLNHDPNDDADPAKSLADAIARFLGDADGLIARFDTMVDLRQKDGRTLSDENRVRLVSMQERIAAVAAKAEAGPHLQRQIDALAEEARFLGVTLP